MPITVETLAAQPFLKGMAPRHLEVLASEALPVGFKADEVIFTEGGPANRFYLLRSGKVVLEAPTDPEHEPVLIEAVGAGGVVGWSWLFPPYYWHFTARAAANVRAICFYGGRLREQCENDHELGYELMRRMNQVIIERLQCARRQLGLQDRTLLSPV